jgi:hypothetical protein
MNPPEVRQSPEELRANGADLITWLRALSLQCNATASRCRLGDALSMDERLRSAADGIDEAVKALEAQK